MKCLRRAVPSPCITDSRCTGSQNAPNMHAAAFEVPRDHAAQSPLEHIIHDAVSDSLDASRCDNVPSIVTPERSDFCRDQHPPGLRAESLDFPKWRSKLVPLVLKTRTPFAAFLATTIRLSHLPRLDQMTSTFFPVPLPTLGLFGRMPSSKMEGALAARHMSQAVHTIVAALNYWYSGGRFGDVQFLRRRPNKCHVELYRRLRSLMESEGPAFLDNVPKAGRRFPELIARLDELTDMLTRLGVSASPYDKTYQGFEVPKGEPAPEAKPYQDMDPEKLLLFGKGTWDVTEFLPDDLVMAYREPRSLLHGYDVPSGPNIRDSPTTLAKLAKKWDDLGLLYLHRKPVHSDGLVRIFGAMKDTKVHRQIGDRRGQNARESIVVGPSRNLPNGCDFTELYINPNTHRLAISITDRKDFYHQIHATQA